MKLELTLDQANKLLEYLGKQPFAQVFQLIDMLQKAIVPEPEVKKTEEI